ncbi:MAG: type II toxin-antitoxin system HipA family toxin [Planctomycetota bacterium]
MDATPHPDRLQVFFATREVGDLVADPDRKLSFQYAPDWLAAGDAFPISLSMPLRGDRYAPPVSHNFFANLLPEANVRARVCAKLKISADNDFELLRAIGGDCAGALSITSGTPSSDADPAKATPISDEQLAAWSTGTVDAFSAVSGEGNVRLSLAGAQDKLPIHVADGRFLLPEDRLASTHLLKFASPFFSHLPDNEALTTLLARNLGLNVVNVQLVPTAQARVLLIERYDRVQQGAGWLRLHQEDFCQALGIGHLQKYEKEGGPSLKQCADLIRGYCSMPALDIDGLLQWSLFNLLAGNSDAHGKNISILYGTDGSIQLAPFYDLVCTRNYERLDRHLAMNLGGETDPGLVRAHHLEQLAADLKVNSKLVTRTMEGLLERLPTTLDKTVTQFNNVYGESPVLERLPQTIRQQVRRTKTMLTS